MNEITKNYLQQNYELHLVDYRDQLDAKDMMRCLNDKSPEHLFDFIYCNDNALVEIMIDIYRRMTADGHEDIYDEDRDEIRDWVQEHDISQPIEELCSHSSFQGRVVQHSNYDCWVPPYDMGFIAYDRAFKETVDMLDINPRQLKKELSKWTKCEGSWPNLPKRKPIVDTKSFAICTREMCCYGLWGFFGKVSGSFLYRNHYDIPTDSVIPKDTACGWCNWWNGGATLDPIKTVRDVSIEELRRNLNSNSEYSYVNFELDERGACNGYSIMPEVYGTSNDDDLFKES